MTRSYFDTEPLDEPEGYSPMLEDTLLLSDGSQFYQVPSMAGSPRSVDSSSRDTDMDLDSTSPVATAAEPTYPLPYLATPTSTAPAVAATPSGALPPSSADITEIIGPQPVLSHQEARAYITAYILAAVWFQSHAMEPSIDQPGVPDCALQLAKEGDSIWACFFKRIRRNGTTVLKCVACGHETVRLNRAVDHQRTKWQHRPFACEDPGCDFRGSTSGSVSDHRSPRTGTVPCGSCGKAVMIKNMPRHLLRVHRR